MPKASTSARYQTVVESPLAGVICTDETGTVRYCSRRAAAMFGYGENDIIGTKVADLIIADGLPESDADDRRTLTAIGQRSGGAQFTIDLTVVSVKAGASDSLVWIVRERSEGAAELEDPLTRLPNRVFCFERIRERLEHGSVNQGSFAVMIVGLDGVEDMVKRAGQAAGVAILVETAARLRHAVPGADLIGYLGNATFCIIAADAGNAAELESLARTIAESIGFPIETAGENVQARPKIGVAIAPADGDSVDLLVEHAEAALDRAKRDTAATVFYSADVTQRLAKRREMQDAIRRGLDTNQFSLDFLPLIDLATGAVVGAEALLRWRHPDRGDIPPLDFIPLAEESGLMIPVGTWVIREALRNAKQWNAGPNKLQVAVNVSARQLLAPGFTRQLHAALSASGCRPEWLELELTEATAMHHAATVQMLLSEIRAMKVRIALDDFGTGYSSMAFLKSLPVDIIKIDRTFVDGVPHDNSDSSIVRAIVAFALCTGREVRAEGVTSIEQARWLEAEGCDAAQGFFFSKPIRADAFEAWLAAYHDEGRAAQT
jgi:diguanylate cyclase (GGDEF)-like protein/PAS domain S-box-containing protein